MLFRSGTAIVRDAFAKDVENRTRNIVGAYRGPVAIHAGLGLPRGRRGTRTTFLDIGEVERDLSGLLLRSERLAWPYRLPLGAVIGVAELVDVHFARSGDYEDPCGGYDDIWGECFCSPWAEDLAWHLVLRDPQTLARPIPWRGQLGLWTVPADLEAAIREQVAA